MYLCAKVAQALQYRKPLHISGVGKRRNIYPCQDEHGICQSSSVYLNKYVVLSRTIQCTPVQWNKQHRVNYHVSILADGHRLLRFNRCTVKPVDCCRHYRTKKIAQATPHILVGRDLFKFVRSTDKFQWASGFLHIARQQDGLLDIRFLTRYPLRHTAIEPLVGFNWSLRCNHLPYLAQKSCYHQTHRHGAIDGPSSPYDHL